MPEEIVQGNSLEEIRQEWADKLKLLPEDITLEVIEKPRFFSRLWKVRINWKTSSLITACQARWDGTKYILALGEGVKKVIPFEQAGEIWLNGVLQTLPFPISLGDRVEFHPLAQAGQLTWELNILLQGLSSEAKVRHELPGHYILIKELPASEEINLAQCVVWEELPTQGEIWDEARLKADLEQLKIVHGIRPGIWSEILAVKGVDTVVVAEATLPVPCEHAQLEDFVGNPQTHSDLGGKSVDFFASKVQLVKEGTILARKIPGKPGVPGENVLGKVLPATTAFKDFQFRLKKNVKLSDDGLEVLAACDGQPVRIDDKTYMVENVFVLHQDVDLATGSIEFPGDVLIDGNVQDGLHIFAGGTIEIKGSVSHAEIRAEKGAKIHQNLLGGKIMIGERFVIRSALLRSVSELRDQLSVCLRDTGELIQSPGAVNLKPGQCLKLIMEKRFPELPKLSSQVEKFILEHKDDEMITEGIIVSIRTAKHFLAGLGPLDLQALPFLQRVEQSLGNFIENISLDIPDKVGFVVSYVQGATIECGGTFECYKGTYNSDIRVEGDIKIEGVCRGGKIIGGGQVSIAELGGSGVSSTFVQISADSRLLVEYCHPNIIIAVGKEIIRIEEAYRKLVIYREKGKVQLEKIRVKPL